jgi:hypothetical protein
MPWRPCATALRGHPSPGSGSSTRKAKSVRDCANSNCSNRRELSSTPRAVLTYDASAGKDLIQPGQRHMASACFLMSMPRRNSSICSSPRYRRLRARTIWLFSWMFRGGHMAHRSSARKCPPGRIPDTQYGLCCSAHDTLHAPGTQQCAPCPPGLGSPYHRPGHQDGVLGVHGAAGGREAAHVDQEVRARGAPATDLTCLAARAVCGHLDVSARLAVAPEASESERIAAGAAAGDGNRAPDALYEYAAVGV